MDADGDVTARGADTFAYDHAYRLKSATVAGATTASTCDDDGIRASKTIGGVATRYAYGYSGNDSV